MQGCRRDVPVSVIVPCYRCSLTIERAISSIVLQVQKPAEVILIDDASGDETLNVIQALEKQYSGWIKVVSLSVNVGAASARNSGWEIATQPYIAFLDSDDAWHPRKLEIQYAFMRDNPSVVLSGHGHRILKGNNENLDWKVFLGKELYIQKWQLLVSNRFVTPSVMVRRGIKQRFIEKQRYMEDHMLWLQIIYSGATVVKLPIELAAIYKSPFGVAGLSSQLWLMEYGELKNLANLYRERKINWGQLNALRVFSLLKYTRRVIVYWGLMRWKKKK